MSRLKLIIQISAILLVGITQSLAQSAPPRDEMILRPDAGREIGRIYQAWLTPLQAYKARAGGRGYQTLINETLREAMRGVQLADLVRNVIREELHTS